MTQHYIAPLTKRPSIKTTQFAHAFAFQIPKEMEQRVGSVALVISLPIDHRTGAILTAYIEDAFIHAMSTALQAQNKNTPLLSLFEESITRVNQTISRLIEEKTLILPEQDIRAAIILRKENLVLFTTWGSPMVLLCRRTESNKASLFRLTQEQSEVDKKKFSAVFSGDIQNADRIIAATHDVFGNMTADEYETVLSAQTIPEAVQLLSRIDEAHGSSEHRAFLVLMTTKENNVPHISPNDNNAQETKQKTISPKTNAMYLKIIITVVLLVWKAIKMIAKELYMLRDTTGRMSTKKRIDSFFQSLVARFNALSQKKRILFFSACTCVYVTNGFIAHAFLDQRQQSFIAKQELAIADIHRVIDSAEAAALYKNLNDAESLLVQAESLTESFNDTYKKQELAGRAITERIGRVRNGIYRITPLAKTNVITTLSDKQIIKLASKDTVMYAVNESGGVFQINESTGSKTILSEKPQALPDVFVMTGDSLLKINKDQIDPSITVQDAEVWNGFVYILDASRSRITRHYINDEKLGATQFYMKDGTDLSRAVSLAIDGAIWIVTENGDLIKIIRGVRESFPQSNILPKISAPIRVRSPSWSDSLFILDASPGRIIEINKKTGELVAQYTSDSLSGVTDFIVSSDKESFILAKENAILRISR